MLKLTGVSKIYTTTAEKIPAIDGVSLEVKEGELVVVRGASGCGKTTLLLCAGGLLSPTAGDVEIDGEQPYKLEPGKRAALRAEKVGFVFQQFHLVPYLTVLDNVLTPTLAGGGGEAGKRAEQLLDRVGMTGRVGHLPSELSTGERQRTAIARAMLNDPTLILADEPTGNLDEKNGEAVLDILRNLADEQRAVMMVTHDASAEKCADRVLRMADGRIEG